MANLANRRIADTYERLLRVEEALGALPPGGTLTTVEDGEGNIYNIGGGGGFGTDVGNGVSTTFNIAHNLNTRDLVITAFRNSAPYDVIEAEISHTDLNNAQINFGATAPAANEYRVFVAGGAVSPTVFDSPLTTKGDIFVFSTVSTRLPVGPDDSVLIADSSEVTGLRWGTVQGGDPYFVANSSDPFPVNAGLNGLTMGPNASLAAAATNGIAIGNGASITDTSGFLFSDNSIAIGTGVTVNHAQDGIAIGNSSSIDGPGTIQGAVSLGSNNTINSSDVLIVGNDNFVDPPENIVIGTGISLFEPPSSRIVAIGLQATVEFDGAANDVVAIGYQAQASSLFSIGIGSGVVSNSPHSIALGLANIEDACDNSIAIGNTSEILNASSNSIAIGNTANVQDPGGIAGFGSFNNISIGNSSSVDGCYNVTNIGEGSITYGNSVVNIGYLNNIAGDTANSEASNIVAIGSQINAATTATEPLQRMVLIGHNVSGQGLGSIAIGDSANVDGNNSIQLGSGTNITDGAFQYLNNIIANSVGGIQAVVSAGAPTSLAPDGTLGIDGTNDVFYIRSNATWIPIGGEPYLDINATGGLPGAVASDSIAMGPDANVGLFATDAIVIGNTATAVSLSPVAAAVNGIAIGAGTTVDLEGDISIGAGANTSGGPANISLGQFATSTGGGAIAIGGTDTSQSLPPFNGARALATGSIAIGSNSGQGAPPIVVSSGGIALGSGTNVSGSNGIAIGTNANATSADAVQIGSGTNANTDTLQFLSNTVADDEGVVIPTHTGAATAPSYSADLGRISFNTTDFTLYIGDGTTWRVSPAFT